MHTAAFPAAAEVFPPAAYIAPIEGINDAINAHSRETLSDIVSMQELIGISVKYTRNSTPAKENTSEYAEKDELTAPKTALIRTIAHIPAKYFE